MATFLVVDNNDGRLILSVMLEEYQKIQLIELRDTDAQLIRETIDNNDDIVAIFTELRMPKMSGFELFDQVKDYGIPVFAFTIHIDLIDKALSYGFADILEKPIEERDFDAIIASLDLA